MKRNDDVFFFTLIDFLLQVLFFGLLFFTLVTQPDNPPVSAGASDKIDHDKVMTVTAWTGFLSIPFLADFLKPLPIDITKEQFKDWAPFISNHHYKDVKLKFDYVEDRGGIEVIDAAFKKAFGKPSCLLEDQKNKSPTRIAKFRLTDDKIDLINFKPEFQTLLTELNIKVSDVASLTLADFRNRFGGVRIKHPDCIYYVLYDEKGTLLKAPYHALNSAFN